MLSQIQPFSFSAPLNFMHFHARGFLACLWPYVRGFCQQQTRNSKTKNQATILFRLLSFVTFSEKNKSLLSIHLTHFTSPHLTSHHITMVRSLKFIGIMLSLAAGGASAFTPSNSQRVAASRSLWGTTFRRDSSVIMSATATIEKESFKTGGAPAVLERPLERTIQPTEERTRHGSEAWEVRIYNDGLNTREHVARSLVQVTGMSESVAYQTMMQAHQNGIAVVGRWVYEVAEMYHDSLKDKGIVCDIVPVDEDQ